MKFLCFIEDKILAWDPETHEHIYIRDRILWTYCPPAYCGGHEIVKEQLLWFVQSDQIVETREQHLVTKTIFFELMFSTWNLNTWIILQVLL